MGDHRCIIKIEFLIHNDKYQQEWNVNYWPEGDGGMDQRIVDWFNECWEDTFSKYQQHLWEIRDMENKERIEEAERKYLKKLKDKYEK